MKIFFVLQLPPPIHGSTVIGDLVKTIYSKKSSTKSVFLNIGLSNKSSEIGVFNISKFFYTLFIYKELIKTLLFYRPDVIYFAPTIKGIGFTKDFFNSFVIKLFRKKTSTLYYHLHNRGIPNKENTSKFLMKLYKYFFKNVYVILLSNKLYDELSRFVKINKVIIVPNGLPDSFISYERKNNNDLLRIGFLSNLIISKGVLTLLDALMLLKENGIGFSCVIAGAEAELTRTDLLKEFKKRGLCRNIQYVGPVNDLEKIEFFNNINLFVFPTFYSMECLPLVLIEAAACGLPLISTNIGAISDIVRIDNGKIIEPNNPEKLMNALKYFSDNLEVINAMGSRSRIIYESEFSIKEFEKRITSVLIERK